MKVAVVGGGLIGRACAWELSTRGHKVTVFDDARSGTASLAAAGLLIPAGGRISRSHLALKLESARLFTGFVSELSAQTGIDCRYHRCGTLTVAWEPGAVSAVSGMVGCLRGLGLDVVALSNMECRQFEPELGEEVGAGYLCPDHVVDPVALQRALSVGGEFRGVESVGTTVTSVGARGVGWEGGLERGFDRVVVASGAWMSRLLDLGVSPVKGETLEVHAPHLILARNICVQRESLYLAYREPGRYVVGATEEECGFEESGCGGDFLRARALRLLPRLDSATFGPTRMGFRPKLGDGLPLIGEADGVYVAGGHYRNGVLLAPVTAKLVCEMIETGEIPELARPFDPTRDTRKKSWKA